MELDAPHMPPENAPLEALLEHYLRMPTTANGDAIVHELRTGQAQLYTIRTKDTDTLVRMVMDGKLMNMFQAATKAELDEAELAYRDTPDTMRLSPAKDVTSWMEKCKVMVMLLNAGHPTEMVIGCVEGTWRVAPAADYSAPPEKPRTTQLSRADRSGRSS